MPDRIFVNRSTGWNPTAQCWESIDIYWEAESPLDLEWESKDCYITRTPWILWTEKTCWVREGDAEVVRERRRESTGSYVVAQRVCRDKAGAGWIEKWAPASGVEVWNVEGEFWRSVPR